MTGLTGLQPPPVSPPEGAPPTPGGSADDGAVARSNPLRLLVVVGLLAALGILVGVPVLVLVLALILSIFLHEVGHFVAARRSGMLVTEFFLGMGPRVWSFRRGEVEYGIKAFPLGAYVRIVGMSNLEQVEPELEDRTYRSKNYPRRLVTVLAGPAVNIAIGIVLFFALYLTTGYSSPQQWSVGRVVDGGAAEAAGLAAGDRVVGVNGEATGSWDEFTDQLDNRAGQEIVLEVERDGSTFDTTTRLGWALARPGAQALPTDPTLPAGARVVAVNGEPVADYAEFIALLGGTGTADVDFEVGSGTYRARLPLPVTLPADGARGFLGVSQGDASAESLGPAGAAVRSVGMVGEIGGSMVDFLGRLFSPSGITRYAQMLTGTGDDPATDPGDLVPLQSLDGSAPVAQPPRMTSQEDADIRPLSLIGIVQVGDQLSGVSGFESVLFLLAMVNIFLGLVNLLPLLPFDGGHATVATYEAVRGAIAHRPYRVDLAKLMPVTYVVVFVLLGIGLSAMYLDIVDPVRIVP